MTRKNASEREALARIVPDIAAALVEMDRFDERELILRFGIVGTMAKRTIWEARSALLREKGIDFRPVGGGNYERVRELKHFIDRANRSRKKGMKALFRAREKIDCVAVNDLSAEERQRLQATRDKVNETLLNVAIAERKSRKVLPEGL